MVYVGLKTVHFDDPVNCPIAVNEVGKTEKHFDDVAILKGHAHINFKISTF